MLNKVPLLVKILSSEYYPIFCDLYSRPSVCLFVYLLIYSSVCPSVCTVYTHWSWSYLQTMVSNILWPVCPSVCLSVCFVFLFIYLSVCPSIFSLIGQDLIFKQCYPIFCTHANLTCKEQFSVKPIRCLTKLVFQNKERKIFFSANQTQSKTWFDILT